ncbi:uncharacterized protein CCR75_008516 [Bremia lactucae]|uniref:Exonuclease domain-containing protein n=1 Tax=Bremia lactucae TaxID=4779 RepID=A0A976NZP3_BRELC|nr:hypothetical protein CCR75_008516 [Bremia lactucae]
MATKRVFSGARKRKFGMEHVESNLSKKQRVRMATITAMDVMNKLLAPGGDVAYDVTDAEWEKLVQLTQAHERFETLYRFPDLLPGWVTTTSKKKKTHYKIVAIDCEMCVTQKAGVSERKSNALCRVSAIDGENILKNIISDFLVHQPEPGFHMVDPKTDIHGITPIQIADCRITMAQAQKKMLKYINKDTIVVGHSVSGDLSCMRISHRRVIDTALIFQRKVGNLSSSTPGLKDLTKFLLGFDMPQGHDSTVDAQASMLAAKYGVRHELGRIIPSSLELHGPRDIEIRRVYPIPRMEYAGPPILVTTAYQPRQVIDQPQKLMNGGNVNIANNKKGTMCKFKAMTARSCRLRVHRIPKGLTSKDVEKWFLENACIVPTAVEKISWLPDQNRGSCIVTFSTSAHAALAFESALGPDGKTKITKDSIGRPQKTIAIISYMGKTFKNVVLGVS